MGGKSATRLHVVTGKGGTGKTSVAAALSLHLAAGGQNVLLIEVEGRQGIAQLFDVPQLPYEERKVALARGGGDVFALAIDPEDALYEYLDMYYHLGRAGKALRKVGVVEFATTVAPGVRDVLLTGKAYEACRRRDGKKYTYDAVVIDAPPTGRIGRFLNVNAEVAGLAKVGPIRRQADSIMGLLRSPRTAVHVVTLLEEMPVQETADAVAELRGLDIPVGTVVVNQTRHPALNAAQLRGALQRDLDAGEVSDGLKAAGLATHEGLLDALLHEAAGHAERVQLEANQRRLVDAIGQPVVSLPWLADGVDLAGLYELSDLLGEAAGEVPW
ncbi:MAG TPA: ArsA-related P-loop ATPase [Actinomycetes bacterium]|nr:ArsA-related P-loop ATPase [Actinomycetes bacterium]